MKNKLLIIFGIVFTLSTSYVFASHVPEGNAGSIFNSKNGAGLIALKTEQEVDVIFTYDSRNDKIFDGYVYYNIAENGKLIQQSQNFIISEIPKTFKFSYTPQEAGIFSFTKGAMSHSGIWGGEQGRFIIVLEEFSKAMKFNGQCKKPFPKFTLVIKHDFSTGACVKQETKEKLIERGWAKQESNKSNLEKYGKILDKINRQAILYQKDNNQEQFDKQMKLMQKKQKELASQLLDIRVSKASVIEGWNFPLRDASEVKPVDPNSEKPICDILPRMPAHLNAIKDSEMFQMFIEKYFDNHITFEVSDERNSNAMIHYDLIATSDDESFTASTYFHLDSCTDEMNWQYFLMCKDTRNGEHISTRIKSEIISSLASHEFCNIELEPWHKALWEYQIRISEEIDRLAREEVPTDSDGNVSHQFFLEFERLGLLNDIIRYYESDNSDHEKMQEDITEYNKKFGSLPDELLELIEQRK